MSDHLARLGETLQRPDVVWAKTATEVERFAFVRAGTVVIVAPDTRSPDNRMGHMVATVSFDLSDPESFVEGQLGPRRVVVWPLGGQGKPLSTTPYGQTPSKTPLPGAGGE